MSNTNQHTGMRRKDFLRYILIAGGISVVGGGAYLFQRRGELNSPLTAQAFRDQYGDLEESLRLIGEKYLEMNPGGLTTNGFLNELNEKLSSDKIDKKLLSDLSDLIRQQILLDFKKSDLVELEGWIITETEAQICALISM